MRDGAGHDDLRRLQAPLVQEGMDPDGVTRLVEIRPRARGRDDVLLGRPARGAGLALPQRHADIDVVTPAVPFHRVLGRLLQLECGEVLGPLRPGIAVAAPRVGNRDLDPRVGIVQHKVRME